MEDEEKEIFSASDTADSSDEFTVDGDDEDYNYNDNGEDDEEEQQEESVADSPPSDEDRKSKNVDALVR